MLTVVALQTITIAIPGDKEPAYDSKNFEVITNLPFVPSIGEEYEGKGMKGHIIALRSKDDDENITVYIQLEGREFESKDLKEFELTERLMRAKKCKLSSVVLSRYIPPK